MVVQSAVRRWLASRQNCAVWSVLTQPRPITRERAAQLRREVEVWQGQHEVCTTDEKELEELYRTSQKKFNRFAASLPSRYEIRLREGFKYLFCNLVELTNFEYHEAQKL